MIVWVKGNKGVNTLRAKYQFLHQRICWQRCMFSECVLTLTQCYSLWWWLRTRRRAWQPSCRTPSSHPWSRYMHTLIPFPPKKAPRYWSGTYAGWNICSCSVQDELFLSTVILKRRKWFDRPDPMLKRHNCSYVFSRELQGVNNQDLICVNLADVGAGCCICCHYTAQGCIESLH